MIARPLYYSKLLDFVDKPCVKILSGIRRSGKSTIVKLIQENLISNGIAKQNIIYLVTCL